MQKIETIGFKGSVKKSTSRIQDNFHLQKRIQECPSQDMIPDNIEGTFNLTLSKMLFDDQNEKALAIKENSYFWQYLSSFVKHDGKLHREFVEEGDNYVSRVEKTENGYLINGRTLEDLRQESMMESDEGEEEKPAATD